MHGSIDNIGQDVLKGLRKRRTQELGLRMAPMIDVIFLLLIFFVLTAKFRPLEQFLPLLPGDRAGGTQTLELIEPLEIFISDSAAGCVIDIGRTVSLSMPAENMEQGLAEFAGRLATVMEKQKRIMTDPIEIRCDKNVKWNHLVKVYNVLYAMGVNDITFVKTD